MSVFKCKMCGGALEVQSGDSVAVCEYCGTKQTLPKLDDDRKANLYDRANHFRRNNDFDKAMGIYEQILNEDNTDAEAYWSIVLCRYGIEYVEDPASHKRIPTVNRAQFTSVFADEDYKSAIEHADGAQREIYEHEAKTIDEIQKGILAISQKEEPFDVFICYKETDASGRRTQDSVLANDLYHQLTQEGFKVFFARITLEDKLGTAYEPYIFAALNSAKVMVVLGTKPEYFNAVWVKNEWSRYLALIKNGAQKVLVPAYKDMDPYDLPEEFSHLQAQDMSKLGFMQDLIRGIKKLTAKDEPKAVIKETVVVNNSAEGVSSTNVAPLLKRAFMFLEDREWESADEYCEKVLDIDPENAEAYLGKLMAELQVSDKDDLSDCSEPFDHKNNYQKVIRFCDDKLRAKLEKDNKIIRDRVYQDYLDGLYEDACDAMENAETEEEYKDAAEDFEKILDVRDSKEKKEKCLELAETARKQAIYVDACSFKNQQTIKGYEGAILRFEQIFGFKDAEEQVAICKKKIEEIKIAEEKAKIEAERKAEAERIAAEAQRKKNKKIAAIVTPIVAVAIAAVVIFTTVIQPQNEYNAALMLMGSGKYEEAITAFEAMDGYKDSAEQIKNCENEILEQNYQSAVALMENGKCKEAIVAFEELGNYKDAVEQIANCKNGIQEQEYQEAVALMNSGNYIEAIIAFETMDAYKDSVELSESAYEDYLQNELSKAQVGESIYFGQYYQDNDFNNGKELVEWIVLDKKENEMFVVSKYALLKKRFDGDSIEVTWENSEMREWLNNSFLEETFSATEQKMISTTKISNGGNSVHPLYQGKDTWDKVFLLSSDEVQKYFTSNEERQCKPTIQAMPQGKKEHEDNATCAWLLRTIVNKDYGDFTGAHYRYVIGVRGNGSIDFEGGTPLGGTDGIRPAMWIDLSAIE